MQMNLLIRLAGGAAAVSASGAAPPSESPPPLPHKEIDPVTKAK